MGGVSEQGSIQLPTVWVGRDDLVVEAANQFLAQIAGPHEIILAIGHVAPPITLGTPEEQATQLQALPFVQVRAMLRLSLSEHRLRELIDVLQQVLANHQANFGGTR